MKIKLIPILAAAFFGCVSCVELSSNVGENFLPGIQGYNMFNVELPLECITNRMADSLSGFSQTKMAVGSIVDSDGNVVRRAAAVTIAPLRDSLDWGTDPVIKSMFMVMSIDTTSVADPRYTSILQRLNVYELEKTYTAANDFDCNGKGIRHKEGRITKGDPMIAGPGIISFELSEEYASKFLTVTQADLEDSDKYFEKIPGLYFDTPDPLGEGGRINILGLQVSYASEYNSLDSNFGTLTINSTYNGERKDTSFMFYLGANDIFNADSLITHSATGVMYPQYALNLTDEDSRRGEAGQNSETISVSGGGGLKPYVSAAWLKKAVSDVIAAEGGNPETAIINKASLILPFEFPDDYTQMFKFSEALSPTTRIKTDTSAVFVSLTDSSNETENGGEINRSTLVFSPDFTYHMQKLLSVDDADIANGNYDIWLLTMTTETTTIDNSNAELSQMYEELAYQSYYNSMYGGGGYGSYGYGDSYTNYYNYMMMANYAANNVSSSSALALNLSDYFNFKINGPAFPDKTKRPKISITFSLPEKK